MSEIIASTSLVIDVPPSVVNVISSPIFNSELNKVPKPVTAIPEFATDREPVIFKLSP